MVLSAKPGSGVSEGRDAEPVREKGGEKGRDCEGAEGWILMVLEV
jgi:hypothetical protein